MWPLDDLGEKAYDFDKVRGLKNISFLTHCRGIKKSNSRAVIANLPSCQFSVCQSVKTGEGFFTPFAS